MTSFVERLHSWPTWLPTPRKCQSEKRRVKQSTQNVPYSVDLQEACPEAKVLVDGYSRRNLHLDKRVYAIVDEQSNSSLVTSKIADDLGADGPLEKYFLSTFSGEKEEKYDRRVAGFTVRSLSGAGFARKEPHGLSDWPSAGPSVVRCAFTSPVVLNTS